LLADFPNATLPEPLTAPALGGVLRRTTAILLGSAIALNLCGPIPSASAAPLPDLIVTALSNPPSSALSGDLFKVTDKTKNRGAGRAKGSVIRYYLSPDKKWGKTDLLLGSRNVPALRSGATSRGTVQVEVPMAIKPASYFLIACADAAHRVRESNEKNNCRAPTRAIAVGSSQDLIEQDLQDGLIDYGTSLIYRAWALFWDPRLPARYDGAGSSGEDGSLFVEIEEALSGLPSDQQQELRGFIARPTDPLSPFGPVAGPAAGTARRRERPLLAEQELDSTKCELPNTWISRDWPNDNSNVGFRAWVCAANPADAQPVLSAVLTVGADVWPEMTKPEPNGMGLPVPDTNAPDMDNDGQPDNDGNGKIDIYVLGTNQCRDRQGVCKQIPPKGAVAAASKTRPCNSDHDGYADLPGYPAHACSAVILLSRDRLGDLTPDALKNLAPDLVHEFFHVLEFGHNFEGTYDWGSRSYNWYVEASAEWAEWYYAPAIEYAPTSPLGWFKRFQKDETSLLFSLLGQHPYASWVWPLFQRVEGGASNVFMTWSVAEGAFNPEDVNGAIGVQESFDDYFRDFAVRNLQPYEYDPTVATGLEDDWWRAKLSGENPNPLADFPLDPHHLTTKAGLALGTAHTKKISKPANIKALAAQYDRFSLPDSHVRQIEIDLTGLANVGTADLDVVGQLNPEEGGPEDPWTRVRANGPTLTLCRDKPDENFKLLYVVISNHSSANVGNVPDSAATVNGTYTIESKDSCDPPDHYDVTFSGFSAVGDTWSGVATFDLYGAASSCTDPDNYPPDNFRLDYCYRVATGPVPNQVQWSWTQPPSNDCTYVWDASNPNPQTAQIVQNPYDFGNLDLTIRESGSPEVSMTYHAHLFPYPPYAIKMTGQVTCPPSPDSSPATRYADDTVLAWLGTPDPAPGQHRHIGDGWQLSGTWTGCGEGACQGLTWDLQPRWDP
jgi:CARDB